MPFENTVDIQETVGENYTCVFFESLRLHIPGSEITDEDIIRDYPPVPLTERDISEIQSLRTQPFFTI